MKKIAITKYFLSDKDSNTLYGFQTKKALSIIIKFSESTGIFEVISLKNRSGVYLDFYSAYRANFSYILEIVNRENLLKYHEKGDAKKILPLLIQKESIPVQDLKKYFPSAFQNEDELAEKIGNFDVHFNREDAKERANIESLLENTLKSFQGFGFQKFLYGKIYVVDKLKGQVVADYNKADDSIRLSKKARNSSENVRTLVHEIGHRILHQNGVDKTAIRDQYEAALQGFKLDIKKGTVLTEKKTGDKYLYKGRSFRGRSYDNHEIVKLDGSKPSSSVTFSPDGSVSVKSYQCSSFYFTNFEGDFKIEKEWLPTVYSKTNPDEWFCEILSFALTRKDALYVDFIKKITR